LQIAGRQQSAVGGQQSETRNLKPETIEQLNYVKSVQEKIVLDRFKKHYPEFPKGRVIKFFSSHFKKLLLNSKKIPFFALQFEKVID